MLPHIRNYLDSRGVYASDTLQCEVCGSTFMFQVHHIKLRSRLGGDEAENLIGLCQSCHKRAHFLKKPYLKPEKLYKLAQFAIDNTDDKINI